jgi:hypothetical protein
MWIFLDGGTMMPALVPPSVLATGRTAQIKEARANGWDLQIRGRVREHLEWFIETHMEPGSVSRVYSSPGKDYNVRAYTTREAYGQGLLNASLAIDYVKFKDTAKRYPWGKKYYDLLLKVWGASTMLARPYAGTSKGKQKPPKLDRWWEDEARPEPTLGSTFFDDFEDDPHMHRTKSIHDLTDAELMEIWNRE